MQPIAVDAMGGDHAPREIVAGARLAAEDGIPVLLVGPPDELGDTGGIPVVPAHEVIGMDDDPGTSVRQKKDASMVRAAELVRDGRAAAMVGAGNTGATMASALLRMGRLPGVKRPAIAAAIPDPVGSTPTVVLDVGANAECPPPLLAQFAPMGAVYARERYGVAEPRVGLLSIGEEPQKGDSAVKEAHELLADPAWQEACGARFVGNVEGRDVMADVVDVVVTDGFTGNVLLKALEGAMGRVTQAIAGLLAASDEGRRAYELVGGQLVPLLEELDPELHGGAVLLGVRGVCVIAHGSSTDRAVRNAVRVAAEMARQDVVGRLRDALPRAAS